MLHTSLAPGGSERENQGSVKPGVGDLVVLSQGHASLQVLCQSPGCLRCERSSRHGTVSRFRRDSECRCPAKNTDSRLSILKDARAPQICYLETGKILQNKHGSFLHDELLAAKLCKLQVTNARGST
jgi:hypothetical protein